MDGEGQVDLSRTKDWRNKSKKREANLQGKIVVYVDTQTDPQHTNTTLREPLTLPTFFREWTQKHDHLTAKCNPIAFQKYFV